MAAAHTTEQSLADPHVVTPAPGERAPSNCGAERGVQSASRTDNNDRRREMGMAKAFMPRIAWPSFLLAGSLLSIQTAVIIAALYSLVPYWLCVPVLGYCAFAWYTLIHDAIHGSIIRERKFSWVHDLIGRVGSSFLFYSWPVLRRTHQHHHSHTNSEKDPDHALVGGGIGKLLSTAGSGLLMYVVPYFLLRRFEKTVYDSDTLLTRRELREHLVTMHCLQLGSWALILAGKGLAVLCLFWLPAFIGAVMLMIFFQWLPHLPFDSTDRYENTRVMEFPLADYVLLNQNIHLVHHLWPSVPFYLYRKLFTAQRAYLESKGARIEGLRPSRARQAPAAAQSIIAENPSGHL
ncbi:MAG: fatty acid desaturase [Pseudomonadota bacterium]